MKDLNQTPKFYNKNGDLSAYGFACGYVQFASKTGKEIDKWDNGKEIYLDGAVWAVKHYKDGQRIAWLTFDRLGEARKHYRSIKVN
jgi:hypothetical protein